MSDVGAIVALWGSILSGLGGILFGVFKFVKWSRENSNIYKDLEKRISSVERKVDDHIEDSTRMIKDCSDDAEAYEKRSTEAIDKLTEWVKWMFSNGRK
jgi:hypothetical protein